jgi:hypothetical protein
VVGLLGFAAVGCGSARLSESEIKQALERQPLTYHYSDERYSGDGAVVGGTATNGQATVTFEVVFGEPTIQDPIFPQSRDNIDKFQRGVNEAGYTLTFNRAPSLREGRLQAPIANAIDGALCDRLNSLRRLSRLSLRRQRSRGAAGIMASCRPSASPARFSPMPLTRLAR